MTVWTARRVGSALYCGRPVPDRRHCTGLVARVRDDVTGPVAWLEFGMIEDPPGSHFWRPSNRTAQQWARGSLRQGGHGDRAYREARRAGGRIAANVPDLPWRRRCPQCGEPALVTRTVVVSG